jgi:hypothetical protein
MSMDSRIAKGALAVAVAVAIAVPVAAWAVPGRGAGRTPTANARNSAAAARQQAREKARRQALRDRIAKVLANRDRAFGRAAAHIGARIDDVAALAAKAGTAGGDVSGVTGTLDQARAALEAAKAAEASAIDMFKAVPDAADRRGSFAAAKARAHLARSELSDARALLRSAILKLEAIVTGLAGAAQ